MSQQMMVFGNGGVFLGGVSKDNLKKFPWLSLYSRFDLFNFSRQEKKGLIRFTSS